MPSRPGMSAFYALRVPRAGSLRTASFRPHLTMAALAVRLMVPAVRVHRGLSPPSRCGPAGRTQTKGRLPLGRRPFVCRMSDRPFSERECYGISDVRKVISREGEKDLFDSPGRTGAAAYTNGPQARAGVQVRRHGGSMPDGAVLGAAGRGPSSDLFAYAATGTG